MSSKRVVTKLLLRRDTSVNFHDVVLAEGEPSYSTDTYQFKIGNGIDVWQDLPGLGGDAVVGISEFRQLGSSGVVVPSGDWTQSYISGTKQMPWIWTRTDFRFKNGSITSLYNPQYDASWKEYTFIGIEAPVETTFPCAVDNNNLSIGISNDPTGVVTTTGVFIPSGTIEVK